MLLAFGECIATNTQKHPRIPTLLIQRTRQLLAHLTWVTPRLIISRLSLTCFILPNFEFGEIKFLRHISSVRICFIGFGFRWAWDYLNSLKRWILRHISLLIEFGSSTTFCLLLIVGCFDIPPVCLIPTLQKWPRASTSITSSIYAKTTCLRILSHHGLWLEARWICHLV